MFFVPACSFKNEIDSNYYCQKLKLNCIQDNKIVIEEANFEIILCGGALASPKILMFSGIGDSEQLKSYGIEEMEMATINSNNNPSNDDYSIDDGEGSSSSKFNMNEI